MAKVLTRQRGKSWQYRFEIAKINKEPIFLNQDL